MNWKRGAVPYHFLFSFHHEISADGWHHVTPCDTSPPINQEQGNSWIAVCPDGICGSSCLETLQKLLVWNTFGGACDRWTPNRSTRASTGGRCQGGWGCSSCWMGKGWKGQLLSQTRHCTSFCWLMHVSIQDNTRYNVSLSIWWIYECTYTYTHTPHYIVVSPKSHPLVVVGQSPNVLPRMLLCRILCTPL